jgi:uncharacterized protein (TIGR02391 family)
MKDFPPPEEVLEMEPEELAPFVLKYLNSQPANSINRYNFSLPNDRHLNEYLGHQRYDEYRKRLMEAWMWLEREGFLAPRPGQNDDWAFVTRKGQRVVLAENFEAYKLAPLFPLHFDPVLIRNVKPLFSRGDYDTAVFRAFKEVEMRVRKKGKYGPEDYGVDLMKKAFGPTGNLTDKTTPKAEQDRTRELVTGAIGKFKNPSSHREVKFDDPKEVVDIITFANQLLRMIDRAN